MKIFKKVTILSVSLIVALLPFLFRFLFHQNQTWVDLFGRGEAILLGVVFAVDACWRCVLQTKDRPSRIILAFMAGLICAAELTYYGLVSGKEFDKDVKSDKMMVETATAEMEGRARFSLMCLAAAVVLQIGVIVEEEL